MYNNTYIILYSNYNTAPYIVLFSSTSTDFSLSLSATKIRIWKAIPFLETHGFSHTQNSIIRILRIEKESIWFLFFILTIHFSRFPLLVFFLFLQDLLWVITYGYYCPLLTLSTLSILTYTLRLLALSLFGTFLTSIISSSQGSNWRMESDAFEAWGHLWFCIPPRNSLTLPTLAHFFFFLWWKNTLTQINVL